MADETGQAEMPRYKCHKEVWALKIKGIAFFDPPDNGARLWPVEEGYEVKVNQDYVERHSPQVGGYYVVYADGYESYSPAKAFEEGYTLIT